MPNVCMICCNDIQVNNITSQWCRRDRLSYIHECCRWTRRGQQGWSLGWPTIIMDKFKSRVIYCKPILFNGCLACRFNVHQMVTDHCLQHFNFHKGKYWKIRYTLKVQNMLKALWTIDFPKCTFSMLQNCYLLKSESWWTILRLLSLQLCL